MSRVTRASIRSGMSSTAAEDSVQEKSKKLLWALMVTYFAHYFTFNLWHTTFNNFAVEYFSVDGQQIGLIQSLREIPGFLGFTAGIISVFFSEANIAALSTIILGLGLLATGISHSFSTLVLSSIFMSVGFHFFYTVNTSMIMMVSDGKNVAHNMGKFRSIGSLSAILAMGGVFLFIERVGFRNLYFIAGTISVVFGLYMLSQRSRAGHIPSFRRFVFRKEYWLYYVMSFLEGSKKHVSSTFSIFLLVSVFEISAKHISLIFLITAIITSFTHQQLGKIADRLQERNVLGFYYLFMIAVYLVMGFASNVWVVIVFFVLSRVVMGLSVALNSYFQKIAPAEEITSNVSIRTSIDHVAAIVVPLVGGILWKSVGYHATFLLGVVMVSASFVMSRFIKPQEQMAFPQKPPSES